MRSAFAIVLILTTTTAAHAHSGGTDANGCHTDSSTGSRHCHGDGVGGGVGRGPVSIPGAILSLSGIISTTIALVVVFGIDCQGVPVNQVCWRKFGTWTWFGLSMAATIAGIAMLFAKTPPLIE